jgi:hypothetical protein
MGECGATVEVTAKGHSSFAHELDGTLHDAYPIVDVHGDFVRHLGAEHEEGGRHEFIDLVDRFAPGALRDAGGVPESFLAVRSNPCVLAWIGELATDLD